MLLFCKRTGGAFQKVDNGDKLSNIRIHSPTSHSKTQLAHPMEESCGLLEKGSHLGTLVNRSLYGQETAVQLVDQAHVHHIAEGNKPKCIRLKKHLNENHINHFLEWILGTFIVNICFVIRHFG